MHMLLSPTYWLHIGATARVNAALLTYLRQLCVIPSSLTDDAAHSLVRTHVRTDGTVMEFFFHHNFCVKPYVPRVPRRDPSNRRLNEHGIYIRHCQESNSQPVPSQVEVDPTMTQ